MVGAKVGTAVGAGDKTAKTFLEKRNAGLVVAIPQGPLLCSPRWCLGAQVPRAAGVDVSYTDPRVFEFSRPDACRIIFCMSPGIRVHVPGLMHDILHEPGHPNSHAWTHV